MVELGFEREAELVASDARLAVAALRELRREPFELPLVDLDRFAVDLFELVRPLELLRPPELARLPELLWPLALVRPRVVPLEPLRVEARFDDPR